MALTIAVIYVATHLPLAITALVTYPLMAQADVYLDWPTLCQVGISHKARSTVRIQFNKQSDNLTAFPRFLAV